MSTLTRWVSLDIIANYIIVGKLMKINTRELEGVYLDWAVATCEGYKNLAVIRGTLTGKRDQDDGPSYCNFSTLPNIGQPIIEREHIATHWASHTNDWIGGIFGKDVPQHGPTMLVAGLRCYVTLMLGYVVEVPEELFNVDKGGVK